jgi:hypothetical protein
MLPTYLKLLIFSLFFAFAMGIQDSNSQPPAKKALKSDTIRQDKTSVRNQHGIENTDTISRRNHPKKKSQEKTNLYIVTDSTKKKSKK